MKDLRIQYITRYGAARFVEFNTIMDFTDAFESKKVDNDGTMATATFFEKEVQTKNFNTLQELYDFCNAIMK